ncbi:MAG: hypothetical protein ACRDEA_07000 [Microcystaceae cyanobacterium]
MSPVTGTGIRGWLVIQPSQCQLALPRGRTNQPSNPNFLEL